MRPSLFGVVFPAIVVMGIVCAGPVALAAPIFSDDFNNYTSPNPTATQVDTGLKVDYAGILNYWTGAGNHAIHAVDRTGSGDWAVMLFDSNSITMNNGVAANDLGVKYTVTFDLAAANYANEAQGDSAADFVQLDILRSDNSTLALDDAYAGAWPGTPSNPFASVSYSYVGDGTGKIRLAFSAGQNDGRFSGAVDNVALAAAEVPESPTIALIGAGIVILIARPNGRRARNKSVV